MVGRTKSLWKKTGRASVKAASLGTKALGKGFAWTGKKTWEHREELTNTGKNIVSVGVGAAVEVIKFPYDVVSIAIYSDKKITQLTNTIQEQAKQYNAILRRNKTLFDSGIISGTLIADMLTGKTEVPAEIQKAYERAYPRLADREGFREAASQYDDPDELQGFLSGIKGKLFEMKYVDDLNSGKLPNGYGAFIADSPTQEEWDIGIKGPNNELVEVFQLKATDSLNYVKEAIDTYPDVDIVTTSELESQILMHAAELEGVETIASEIANEGLSASVESAASSGFDGFDLPNPKFPAITLALIAFSAYSEKDASIYKRSYSFGERGAKSMIAYGAGRFIAGITNVWWIGLLGAIVTRYIADIGRKKKATFQKLNQIVKSNDRVIKRYQQLGKGSSTKRLIRKFLGFLPVCGFFGRGNSRR